ncbi:MAG: hypothetical protein GF329_11400 [Candidatus Lokiarchaeota archaeon]|nr:hypothetical protein [Candidatus Lokiarchaeota archaeon]
MEPIQKKILKLSNGFLIVGIIGLINFLLIIIFISLEFFGVMSFPYDNIISSSFGLIISIVVFYLMFNGLKNLGMESSVDLKFYSWSKLIIIFYPISSGLTFLLYVELPAIIALVVFIIFISMVIIGYISLLFLGLYIFKIGKEISQKAILFGGILLIIFGLIQFFLISFIWMACILLFIGLRKYLIELSI